ncbi:vivid PAS protein VVD [Verticillium alfalfae VaMs.102]|uniref:Vivid PAS protein VVD n=1 Tax=Verticillium alfalfae (strain VaMs.102 / ATCC MYA-4576 / FGSC 10136) TaxID=526221 RepID=C9SSX3_VERA1|nr:vivid PAS protein VVD [Verticillium alfalfae VaMs.102]EEY21888.1 vivid PAS protein VVD [Verticillium alfalfae VaMs.102]
MNPWETCALQVSLSLGELCRLEWQRLTSRKYHFPEPAGNDDQHPTLTQRQRPENADPVMYPGLYCPSGFDMMSILFRVMGRSSPKVELGPIDCSVALVLCDLAQPDCPIVYASEAFTFLTGYSNAEILGRNCRFLQAPGGKVSRSSPRKYVDDRMVKQMRKAVEKNDEVQLEVQNFRKDGSPFMNILTMIPVTWDSEDYRYSVGFQVSRDE